MKQIFDWMREEAQEEIMPKGSVSKTELLIKSACYGKVLALIDEAEAKWESDCCEWENEYKFIADKYKRETGCGYTFYDLHHAEPFNFCPYCGKPIKIGEVE